MILLRLWLIMIELSFIKYTSVQKFTFTRIPSAATAAKTLGCGNYMHSEKRIGEYILISEEVNVNSKVE